jgi:hypothetical protein
MFVTTREILYSALRAVQPFMSKDETREHMNGVRIEFADGECHLIATDGVALAHVKLVRPVGERAPSNLGFFLTSDRVKEAIAHVRPKAKERDQRVEVRIAEGMAAVFQLRDANGSTDGLTFRLTKTSEFPPWRQVTPPREHVKKPTAFVGIGGWQLERAGKACKAFMPTGVDRGFVVRTPESELHPVRLDTDHPDRGSLTVVIMPMRV